MKNLLKSIADKRVEKAFTEWRAFSPKMPKSLEKKIEDKKEKE